MEKTEEVTIVGPDSLERQKIDEVVVRLVERGRKSETKKPGKNGYRCY